MFATTKKRLRGLNWTLTLSLISLLIAGIAIYQSSESLHIQNISTNFKPYVVPYIVEAELGVFNYSTSQSYYSGEGNLNLSLIVITPHAMVLNFTSPDAITLYRQNTTLRDNIPLLEPDRYEDNRLYLWLHDTPIDVNNIAIVLPHFKQQFIGFVQPGVTQMNFSFPLTGCLFFNEMLSHDLGSSYHGFATSVGSFEVNMELYDVQTQTSTIETYSGPISMWINVNNFD